VPQRLSDQRHERALPMPCTPVYLLRESHPYLRTALHLFWKVEPPIVKDRPVGVVLGSSTLSTSIQYDWSPIIASGPQSAVAAVLAGFVFAGIVVILSARPKRRFQASQALKLLFTAFLGLAVTSYLLADTTGEQTFSRADTIVAVTGGLFATFAILMLVSLTWLVVAYELGGDHVLEFLRSLIYVAGAFVMLLLCVSSQSYLSYEIKPHGPPAIISYAIYGVGVLAALVALAGLAWLKWLRKIPSHVFPSSCEEKRWNKVVGRCGRVALTYLALISLGAGIVLALPKNWYTPMSTPFVYTVGWTALLLPLPVLVLAGRQHA
jgi:hypothetical protein